MDYSVVSQWSVSSSCESYTSVSTFHIAHVVSFSQVTCFKCGFRVGYEVGSSSDVGRPNLINVSVEHLGALLRRKAVPIFFFPFYSIEDAVTCDYLFTEGKGNYYFPVAVKSGGNTVYTSGCYSEGLPSSLREQLGLVVQVPFNSDSPVDYSWVFTFFFSG